MVPPLTAALVVPEGGKKIGSENVGFTNAAPPVAKNSHWPLAMPSRPRTVFRVIRPLAQRPTPQLAASNCIPRRSSGHGAQCRSGPCLGLFPQGDEYGRCRGDLVVALVPTDVTDGLRLALIVGDHKVARSGDNVGALMFQSVRIG